MQYRIGSNTILHCSGASRLQIGRQSGRYRDESNEGKAHVILPMAARWPPIMLPSDHERNAVGLNAT
jgi:hypothetical protein